MKWYGSVMAISTKDTGSDWRLSLAVASIPAFAAIAAAVIAARSAKTAKNAELAAQYVRELENRISEKKYDVYKPMINLFKEIMNQRTLGDEELRDRISDFSAWVIIFGSDESVKAFHNFMQSTYHSPPPVILMKLYADFVIAARRDMGYSKTEINQKHFLGMRINDLYTHELFKDVDKPLADLCRDAGWAPPWQR